MAKIREDNDPEARARGFVTDVYRSLLRREPDVYGLDYHTSQLLGGADYRDVLDRFLNSEEYQRRITVASRLAAKDAETGALPLDYQPPGEAGRCYRRRVESGFYARYCRGPNILDVGFSGYDNPDRKTAVPGAIGVDLDYPGYDGLRLPFADDSVDTIISSHCLEHILDEQAAIQDWYRVLRFGGHIICMVPHQALYEKKLFLPSRWNEDHKRMYTVSSLAKSFETALAVNSFRIRHLVENDVGFNYSLGPDTHSDGAYEIELVAEKIVKPDWDLDGQEPERKRSFFPMFRTARGR